MKLICTLFHWYLNNNNLRIHDIQQNNANILEEDIIKRKLKETCDRKSL